MKAIGYPEVGG